MANYKDRRSKSADQLQAEQFNDRMQDDRSILEADIKANSRAIRTREKDVENALGASPWNSQRILDAEYELKVAKEHLARLKELLAQEFGDEGKLEA